MYKRILLKLSGEALKADEVKSIFSAEGMKSLAGVIKSIHDTGVQLCIVIGAGNIWRGKTATELGFERISADFMGMLGTVINCVSLASCLNNIGVETLVTSAVPSINGVTVDYDIQVADDAMNQGKVVFLSGGTGKPYFTTDTAATMRAIELNCDAILMGKNAVKGVYDKDPVKNKDAKFYETITYQEMIKLGLQIMDQSALELIKDKNIQIRVFAMDDPNNFVRVVKGEHIGTVCKKGE